MEQYFTVFLCGAKSLAPKNVLGVVDWLYTRKAVPAVLSLRARKTDEPLQLRPGIQGDYAVHRQGLEHFALGSLDITSGGWSAIGTEFFFHAELESRVLGSRLSVPQAISANPARQPPCFGLMTLSIRSDVWRHCEVMGLAGEFLQYLDSLFAEFSFRYGYADETIRPIPGSYALIASSTRSQAPRIIDFDYENRIEKVYRHNFMSITHLSKLSRSLTFESLAPDVEHKDLIDKDGVLRGARITFRELLPRTLNLVRDYLKPLLDCS